MQASNPMKSSRPFMAQSALEKSQRTIVKDFVKDPGTSESSLSQSVVDHTLDVRKSFLDIKVHIDECDKSLRSFIHEELQYLTRTLSGVVQTSKDEVVGKHDRNHANIEEFMGKHDRNHANILVSLERNDSRHDGLQESLRRQDSFLERILNSMAAETRPPTKSKAAEPSASPTEILDTAPTQSLETFGPLQIPRMIGELNGEHMLTPKLRHHESFIPEAWKSFMNKINDSDLNETSKYQSVLDRKLNKRSVWHDLAEVLGLTGLLYVEMPDTVAARITEHTLFFMVQTLLIVVNSVLMGFEADIELKIMLQDPQGITPKWIRICNIAFSILFTTELLFRIFALRTWFFVAPYEWGWNIFDVAVVFTNLLADFLTGINITFLRTFRILRAVRVARLIRVLRFFRNLRQMLFALLACLNALAWAFIFMALLIFMFSLLFIQGLVHTLHVTDLNSGFYLAIRSEVEKWFASLPHAMVSLLAAVTGGADWMEVRRPLEYAGVIYSGAFIAYVLFITVGVMNVLTGVFLSSAGEFTDLTLVVQSEELKVERLIDQIVELFKVMDVSHHGRVDWATFRKMLEDPCVWAYFSSLQMEPTHIRFMFDLFANQNDGTISVNDLVMGIVRLKGESKAIDARIIQRELTMVPLLLETAFKIHDGVYSTRDFENV